MSPQTQHPDRKPAMTRLARVVFVAFAAIAAFFLITEHAAHTFYLLPFLLLAACPLLHLSMHRGHRGHDHGAAGPQDHGHTGARPEPGREDRP